MNEDINDQPGDHLGVGEISWICDCRISVNDQQTAANQQPQTGTGIRKQLGRRIGIVAINKLKESAEPWCSRWA